MSSSTQRKPLEFSTADRAEVSVTIDRRTYVLCEAVGDVAAKFRDESTRGARSDESGRMISAPDSANAAALVLVAGCLFELYSPNDPSKRRPVTVQFVKGLPDSITSALFDEVVAISPTLRGRATLDSLRRQREAIDDMIRRLEEAESNGFGSPEEHDAKNSPTS